MKLIKISVLLRLESFPSGTVVKSMPANAGETGSIPWRKWQRTPESLPGESYRQEPGPWGCEDCSHGSTLKGGWRRQTGRPDCFLSYQIANWRF